MNKSISIFSAFFVSALFVNSTQAALIDAGVTTIDDTNNLEWLDVSTTRGDSVADTMDRITSGDLSGQGWRYATVDEVALLFSAAGAAAPYDGWSTTNEGLADPLMDLWSITFDDGSIRSTLAFVADDMLGTVSGNTVAVQNSTDPNIGHLGEDYFNLDFGNYGDQYPEIGHALVRAYAAPEPASLALMGVGLIGFGFGRRKKVV